MSQAKITRADGYKCAPKGAVVVTYPLGTVVTGQVAEWALQDGAAARMFDPRESRKVQSAPEVKAPRKRGRPRKGDE